MVFCCITNCKSSSKTCNYINKGITFHRFPRDPDVRAKWINVTGRINWNPSDYSRVCSVHFKEEQFDPTTQRRTLIKTAAPSVNIWKLVTVVPTDDYPSSPSTSQERIQQADSTDDEQPDANTENTEPAADKQQMTDLTAESAEPSVDIQKSSAQNTDPVELENRGTKKLCAEVKKSRILIASQRLKIKSLQTQVRRYRKKILQLQQLAKQSDNKTEDKGEYVFFRHFLDQDADDD